MYLIDKLIGGLPRRIRSALIDQIGLVITFAICSIVEELIFTHSEIQKNNVYTAIILFSIFLNKDIYFGKSIGKFFIGLRVVSIRTGKSASPIQCYVRNLFLLLWPIEVFILFFSPERRIGDMVAGTKVLDGAEIVNEMKWQYVQAVISILGSLVLIYYLFTAIDGIGIMGSPSAIRIL
jgi:uncharacterized RDD family membrane protein YckC